MSKPAASPAHRSIHLVVLLFLATGCASSPKPSPEPRSRIEGAVRIVLRQNGYDSKPFELKEWRENGKLHILATYQPVRAAKDGLAHWMLEVSIAEANAIIDPTAYKATAAPTQRPLLGSRYMAVDRINVSTPYAPPGLFSGFAFTTSDGRFDVQIMTSNLLPKGTEPPTVDINALGRKILAQYCTSAEGCSRAP